MATQYRYDDTAKRALRAAITSHPGWQERREALGVSSSALNIELMETIASQMSPPIDCGLYGKPRWTGSSWQAYVPSPKTVLPSVIASLRQRFDATHHFLTSDDAGKFREIYLTITAKQNGMASEKQRDALANIVNKGEVAAAAFRNNTSAPAIQVTPATTSITQSEPQTMITTAPIASSIQAALDVLAAAVQQQQQPPAIDEAAIIALIKQHSASPATVTINVVDPAGATSVATDTLAHHKMPLLVSALAAGVNIMLVGPAGTGKTHAVKLAAELLGRGFKFTGAIDSPYKLTGFTDAQGRVVRTPFRDAVEHGEIFLQDEADACLPGALLPINAVASNGVCDFPDAIVQAHPHFRLVMACNTYGRGADRQYVGRNQQDAAVLDRYAVITWDVDPALEAGMLGLPRPANAPAPIHVTPIHDHAKQQQQAALWLARVQTVRASVERHKVRHVVSPRASVMGAKLLNAGWTWNDVEEACIFKGLDADTRAKINA